MPTTRTFNFDTIPTNQGESNIKSTFDKSVRELTNENKLDTLVLRKSLAKNDTFEGFKNQYNKFVENKHTFEKQIDLVLEKYTNISIDEKEVLSKNQKDTTTAHRSVSFRQGINIARQIGNNFIDFGVMKSRSVTSEIRVSQIRQGINLSTSLIQSTLINPSLALGQIATIGLSEVFRNIEIAEQTRQENQQANFDRVQLGGIRNNGGR